MTPLALTPPAEEPVALAEARAFLRLDQTEEDGLLANLITAARLMVEAHAGRMLIDQHWRIVIDRWPPAGELRLPLSPVSAIVAARAYDPAGIAQGVAPSALALDRLADPPLVRLVGPVPRTLRERAAIEIDLVAGHGATAGHVPALLRQAVLLLAARWFERREEIGGERALPNEVAALVAPFRRARL